MVKFPPIITHAYVMLSEQCNLRCDYCYIKNRESTIRLPFEYFDKLKRAFTCYNRPRIIFFGGEPLLQLDYIKKVVEKYGDTFQYQVVTNGTVNLHQFIEEVYKPNKDNFDIQVSWDGNEYTRKNAGHHVTNNDVYNNIVLELENGAIFEGRCVLDETSVKSFFETYKTFKTLNKLYKFGGDFTIAHKPSFEESFAEDLNNQLFKVYHDIKEQLNTKRTFIPRFLLKTITNVLQNRSVISCDIGTNVVIRPNGDIYPCTILSQTDERFCMGNLATTADTEIITKLRYGARCQKECSFKSVCDGGCRYERIHNFPHTWDCDICSHTCGIYKVIYEKTKEFLYSLTDVELERLYEIINEYNLWTIDYDNGVETDKEQDIYD